MAILQTRRLIHQEDLNVLFDLTTLQTSFFLTLGPSPPFKNIISFRKLAMVSSFSAPWKCKISPGLHYFYNLGMSFIKTGSHPFEL